MSKTISLNYKVKSNSSTIDSDLVRKVELTTSKTDEKEQLNEILGLFFLGYEYVNNEINVKGIPFNDFFLGKIEESSKKTSYLGFSLNSEFNSFHIALVEANKEAESSYSFDFIGSASLIFIKTDAEEDFFDVLKKYAKVTDMELELDGFSKMQAGENTLEFKAINCIQATLEKNGASYINV